MFASGKVITNLDGYENEIWPSVFAEVPKKGSYIESSLGVVLKVVRITHCGQLDALRNHVPYIKIEVGN